MKDTIKYEVAEAERLTAPTSDARWRGRRGCTDQSRQFFERYDYFVLPVTQVAPFDVNVPYPTQIAGTPMATYIDWMRSCWYITFMSNPAISVPAGFTASGCRSGSRSSAGTATTGACCRWRTRSSRPRNTARGAQRS